MSHIPEHLVTLNGATYAALEHFDPDTLYVITELMADGEIKQVY